MVVFTDANPGYKNIRIALYFFPDISKRDGKIRVHFIVITV